MNQQKVICRKKVTISFNPLLCVLKIKKYQYYLWSLVHQYRAGQSCCVIQYCWLDDNFILEQCCCYRMVVYMVWVIASSGWSVMRVSIFCFLLCAFIFFLHNDTHMFLTHLTHPNYGFLSSSESRRTGPALYNTSKILEIIQHLLLDER